MPRKKKIEPQPEPQKPEELKFIGAEDVRAAAKEATEDTLECLLATLLEAGVDKVEIAKAISITEKALMHFIGGVAALLLGFEMQGCPWEGYVEEVKAKAEHDAQFDAFVDAVKTA